MQLPTPSLAAANESINNPSGWEFITWLTVAAVIISLLTLLTMFFIEIIKARREELRRKILAKKVDDISYPVEAIEMATRYYVRPLCSNLDPAQEPEIRNSIATSEDLFAYVDKFLHNVPVSGQQITGSIKYLMILADSGMGKTSFVLNYFAYNEEKKLNDRRRLAIVHLGTPNAIQRISDINKKSETDLILDALDEDTEAVSGPEAYRTRLEEIFQKTSLFKHVVITCRTQFFPREDEIPKSTGIVVIEPRGPGQHGHYELRKIYLNPLTDDQVKEYLQKRYPDVKIEKIGKKPRRPF